MQSLALVIPILPEKTEDWRRFAKEALEARGKDFDESRRHVNLNRETVWIQPTPMGDVLIVYLEGDDPVRSNQAFVASKDPYDLWFKQQVLSITGIDFNQPPPGLPQLSYDWQAR